MAKSKKELLAKAPWRDMVDDEEEADMFKDANLKVSRDADGSSTMHVPRKKNKDRDVDDYDGDLLIDPQLQFSFHRNYQFLQRVFSLDTLAKPLPSPMAYNVTRNFNFFTRIFSQFCDPDGIASAQKSLGLGHEKREQRVR